MAFGYQRENGDDLVPPLAHTGGARYVSSGAKYQVTGQIDISAGVRHTGFGGAPARTSGVPQATFADNSAVSVGFKIGYNF